MRSTRTVRNSGAGAAFHPAAIEELRFGIYPWNLRAWRSAFRIAGIPGYALLALLLGTMLQAEAITGAGGGAGHSMPILIVLVRGPLALITLLLLLFRPRIAHISLRDTRFFFLLFAVLFLVSVLWSQEPLGTFGKSVEIILAGFIFLEVSWAPDALRRVEALLQVTLLTTSLLALIATAGFVLRIGAFVLARPGLFTSTTANAPFLSGNGLGYVSSALFLVVLANWQVKRIKTRSAFLQMGFALAMFAVSSSRTSYLILLLSVLVVLYWRSKLAAITSFAVVALAIAAFWNPIMAHLQGNESTGSFTTLSSRTVVWTAGIQQWHHRPFFGFGGGVGGKVVLNNIGNVGLEQLSSLHNGFMELLTGLGAVGLIIGIYLILLVTWRVWSAWRSHPEFSGTYVLIVHVWLTTIMSTGVFGWMGYEMAFFLCIMTNVDLLHRQARVAIPDRFHAARERAFSMASQ